MEIMLFSAWKDKTQTNKKNNCEMWIKFSNFIAENRIIKSTKLNSFVDFLYYIFYPIWSEEGNQI
jgi:hypothetical protein